MNVYIHISAGRHGFISDRINSNLKKCMHFRMPNIT